MNLLTRMKPMDASVGGEVTELFIRIITMPDIWQSTRLGSEKKNTFDGEAVSSYLEDS